MLTPRALSYALIALCSVMLDVSAQMRPLPKASDVPKLREKAAQGDPVALYQLAVCHFEEIGLPHDYAESLKLALQAAEKGDVPAMVMVSDLYRGYGRVERDKVKSLEWAKKASASGDPLGAVAMALCHIRGFTGSRSVSEAMSVLKQAAASDNTHVLLNLASLHIFDDSLHADPSEGVRLARIADSRGEQEAAGLIAFAHLVGKGVPRDLELAKIYAERDVSRRGKIGRLVLGMLYFQAENLPVDGPSALRELRHCDKHELDFATSLIGLLYLEGNGVPASMTEAARLFRKSARRGETMAMDRLGGMLFQGNGLVMDKPLAMGLWQAAAAMGNPAVQQAINSWGTDLRNSADFAKGSVIAHSIKSQIDAGDYPKELEAGYHSSHQSNSTAPAERQPAKSPAATGSALVFSEAGHCFTNYHVVEGASHITVFIPSTRKTLKAKLVASDMANDLAVLKIEEWKPVSDSHPTPPPLASASKAKIGDKAFTIGFPLSKFLESQEHKYASGDISATSGIGEDRRVFQITTPIQPGNSGGPLALSDGRIIGVIVSTVNSAAVIRDTKSIPQNINFAIKIDYLKLLAASSGIDIPEDLKPGQDPIEHVKAYTVQVIAER